MDTKEVKTLVLTRVPPGDRWTPIESDVVLDSLTEGLEYVFQKTKCTEFHLSAMDGAVFSVTSEKFTPPPPPEPSKFSLYGEY